jgi:hypothetical protein
MPIVINFKKSLHLVIQRDTFTSNATQSKCFNLFILPIPHMKQSSLFCSEHTNAFQLQRLSTRLTFLRSDVLHPMQKNTFQPFSHETCNFTIHTSNSHLYSVANIPLPPDFFSLHRSHS